MSCELYVLTPAGLLLLLLQSGMRELYTIFMNTFELICPLHMHGVSMPFISTFFFLFYYTLSTFHLIVDCCWLHGIMTALIILVLAYHVTYLSSSSLNMICRWSEYSPIIIKRNEMIAQHQLKMGNVWQAIEANLVENQWRSIYL